MIFFRIFAIDHILLYYLNVVDHNKTKMHDFEGLLQKWVNLVVEFGAIQEIFMGAYRGQILKNGRETLFLGQILTFKGLFINPSLASSPFVRTTSPQGAFRNSLRNLKLFPFSPASPFPTKLAARLLREPCLFALSRLTKGLEPCDFFTTKFYFENFLKLLRNS